MNSNLKSLPEGLKNAKCKKGKLIARPPIPYVPPSDLHKKQETEQIKVKMSDRTNFQMAAFGYRNNKEYLVHVIAVLRIIEQKGMEMDVRKAFQALVEVRREMKPLFEFPDDETEAKKQVWKQRFLEYNEILMAKKSVAVAEGWKSYEVLRCFVVGNLQTQWDSNVHKMYTKDPWIGVNRNSNKGPRVCSWLPLKNTVRGQFNKLTALLSECYVGIITLVPKSLQGG
jgi:hypothetical protein